MQYTLCESNWNNYKSLFEIIRINQGVSVYQEYCLSSGQAISEVIPRIGSGPLICNSLNKIYSSSLVRSTDTEPNILFLLCL